MSSDVVGSPSSHRIVALDGLRGIAAVVVVIHHILLLSSSAFAAPYLVHPGRDVHDVVWWMTYSPLHLIWAGGEAVNVFFVLSGLVLVYPLTRGKTQDWLAYFPTRLLRLYLPVWASLALASVLALAVGGNAVEGGSWALSLRPEPTWSRVLSDATLAVPTSGLNGPLWSLRWEVAFSLLLPVFVFLGARWRRGWPVKVLVLAGMVLVGPASSSLLHYLAIFGFGVLLAFHHRGLLALTVRAQGATGGFTWVVLSAAGLLGLLSRWLPLSLISGDSPQSPVSAPVGRLAEVLGAVVVVVLFWQCRPFVAFASRATVQWLGARSYSLYLVHVPIVTTIALLLSGRHLFVALLVGLPLNLLAADAFYRMVERPSSRLARTVGAHTGRRMRGRLNAHERSRRPVAQTPR